jgi:RNA-binding protein
LLLLFLVFLKGKKHMLSGKEKRAMRAQGNQLKASVIIGKDGVSANVKRFIDEAFNNKILVKVKLLDTCPEDRKKISLRLAKIKDTEVVQVLGRTILLFRPIKDEESN